MDIFRLGFSVIAILLAWGAWILLKMTIKRRKDLIRSADFVFLQVRVPKKDSKSDREKENDETRELARLLGTCEQMLNALHGLYEGDFEHGIIGEDFFSLEIVSSGGQIYFYMGCPSSFAKVLEKQITSFYPDAVVELQKFPTLFKEGYAQAGIEFKPSNPYWMSFKPYDKFQSTDPMSNLLNVLSDASSEKGDSAAVQFVLRPEGDGWQKTARDNLKSAKEKKKSLLSMVLNGLSDGDSSKDEQEEIDTQNLLQQKAEKFGFQVAIRAVTSAEDAPTANLRLKSIGNSFSQYNTASLNSLSNAEIGKNKVISRFLWRRPSYASLKKGFLLSPAELTAMWHPPHGRYNTTPGIKWQGYKIVKAPSNIPKAGLLLGHNVFRGVSTPIFMKPDDRMRHFYVIGQTGTGKTTILLNMIRQDLRNGAGFCVIDPHGQLVEDILPFVPKERVDDVIIFNPSDLERPLGLNMLEAKGPDEMEMVALDAMNIMIKLFDEKMFGPRIQDYFRNGVLTLMSDPKGGALTEIVRLFADEDFQKLKVAHVKNPVVKGFWTNQMAKTGAREKAEIIPYFAAKFGQFVTNRMMRNIIGQTKSAFDFSNVMDNGKILLMNLSKGLTGDFNSKLLGLIIVQKIQMAALRRQSQAKHERRDFFLYIDEFQNYVTDSIESILSEARKYRLGLNLAHQYLAQIDPKGGGDKTNLKDAVFGNVGTMVSYKISSQDAEIMAKEMAPAFSDSDLINMDKYKAVMRLSIDTQPSKPFSLVPENPYLDPGNPKLGQGIKQISRLTHGRSRKYVEKEIFARMNI